MGPEDVDISWAEKEKCPACFGDTCELLHRGNFATVRPESGRSWRKGIVSTGKIGDVQVIAKTMSKPEAWRRYEKFICRSSPRPKECNPSSFILETMLVTNVALKLPFLRGAFRIAHPDSKPALPVCLSAGFLKEVKKLFVGKESTEMTNGDVIRRAFLSTSLLISEEAVLLRYFTTQLQSPTPWPFPKFYGACGRVIVVEHAGRTLDAFIDFPWKVRADIAVQLLQLVDTLRQTDPDWILFSLDVTFQNFAVDSRGRVRLIDFDDVLVIDRRTVVNHQEQKKVCNEPCYLDFQKKLYYSDQYHCEDILKYTPMMYANSKTSK
ncbi:divergent protein kinase domain 2A-like [Branchiostoma floridae]|uniref:Divergent protein kinase domain 2A-like n=1 Tax=Branchiostoma floridae TaxID=7739 RepID=A0A9J7KAR3_BRAFL|nr:divergent protein kinase domain 2A-like [Branchiostoma floridae]